MKYLMYLILSLTFLLATSAQAPVPVEKEPRHRLRFSNQYVRVFNVLIPAGDTSLFHIHRYDGLSVRLADARIRDETFGGTSEDIAVKRGAVTFGYRPNPLTHRVSAIGDTPFRNIFVELLPSTSNSPGVSPQPLVSGQTLVLENERVRISRLVLAPGQSIEMHAHALRSLGVAVSDGRIVIEVPGEKLRTLKLKPGDSQWYDGGMKHSLRNAGSAPFEAVEIELK